MSKVKRCVGKESFSRMNYLYQISNLFATENTGTLSNFCSNLMINVSKKTVQRLDVDIKRTICKGCHSVIIPGETSRVRVNRKKLRVTCLTCGTYKLYNLNKSHHSEPWSQNPEALVECFDYGLNKQ